MSLTKTTFLDDDSVTTSFLEAIPRGNQEQIALQPYKIPISAMRYSDGVIPVVAAASGKPGIKMGGWDFGTGYFQGENAKNTTKTEYLSFDFTLLESYDDGEDVKIGITCRVNQSGGTVSVKTVDLQCYKAADDGTVGVDLCATAAQNMGTDFAEYLFVITATGLVRGDRLRCIIKTVVTETANTGTQYAEIGAPTVYADTKG